MTRARILGAVERCTRLAVEVVTVVPGGVSSVSVRESFVGDASERIEWASEDAPLGGAEVAFDPAGE